MSDYEKLSLALLSSIAKGLGHQLAVLDVAVFRKGEIGAVGLKKLRDKQLQWQQELKQTLRHVGAFGGALPGEGNGRKRHG